MFTPAFQTWLSYLGCKYKLLKSSTQILTLAYLPYSFVAVLLSCAILVSQLQHEYSTVSIWVNSGPADCSNRASLPPSVTSSIVLTRQAQKAYPQQCCPWEIRCSFSFVQVTQNSKEFSPLDLWLLKGQNHHLFPFAFQASASSPPTVASTLGP